MLPKVANHLIQHTSRAVAAVQNSAFRNVLQLQSSPNTITNWNGAPSSSGKGGSGAGAGGAKFHSSRFNGYSSLGRGVSLADPSITSGNKGELADDSEDLQVVTVESRPVSVRTRQRPRSGSLTFTIQDTVSTGRVLKAIRQHVRSRHTLAQQQQQIASRSSHAPKRVNESEDYDEHDSTHAIIRELESRRAHSDWTVTIEQVKRLYSPDVKLTTRLFEAAFKALLSSRPKHESIRPILELYNHMLASAVESNSMIHWSLIHSLLAQDQECTQSIELRRKALSFVEGDVEATKKLQEEISLIEDNRSFPLVVSLFQALADDHLTHLTRGTYSRIIESSLENRRLDVARTVFAASQKRASELGTTAWRDYLRLQGESGDLAGAVQTFKDFRAAAEAGRVVDTGDMPYSRGLFATNASVWGEMMYVYIRHGQADEALGLLEEMLDSETDAVPRPNATAFERIIAGFGEAGDPQSALAWFDRLLKQREPCIDASISTLEPTQPSSGAWTSILETLNAHGMYDDLDRLLRLAKEKSLYTSEPFTAFSIISGRISYLTSNPEIPPTYAVAQLDFLVSTLLQDPSSLVQIIDTKVPAIICQKLVEQYFAYGRPDRALDVASEVFVLPLLRFADGSSSVRNQASRNGHFEHLRYVIEGTVRLLSSTSAPSWTLLHAARLAHLSALLDKTPSDVALDHLLAVYTRATPAEKDALTSKDWEAVFLAYVKAPEATRMTLKPLDVFQDGITRGVRIADLQEETTQAIVEFLQTTFRGPQRLAIAAQLGISDLLRQSEVETQTVASDRDGSRTPTSSAATPSSPTTGYTTPPYTSANTTSATVTIDEELNKTLLQMLRNPGESTLAPYNLFERSLRANKYPNPMVLGRLINAVGRLGHLDKVRVLYETAQTVLESMAEDKTAQSLGWFQVEDQMIIALAHAGDVDGAHVHRQRILMQKGTPSPDAYGILIQNIKDTTDDNANSLALFHEAVERGVVPNVYLYNIVISKLARARKADSALELFHAMKARRLTPTSVTYGALIAACGRVGDVASAENLFAEMASQPNFRPRIPPYNMMMQLYTQTKPDRERALDYYNAMLDANIKPTAHTYKLLLDAYGTVEPADVGAMDQVFEQLLADRSVTVNGAHWASLIHAHGCVKKDLDRALAIFDSIKNHPSTKRSGAALPDAVAFEALINVFNTVRRTDLIPHYVAKLQEYGIHMTAYIANVLIRGYAMHGDIEQARAVFDSLVDPPEGIAAPNNHAPHDSEHPSPVPATAPVFREPSTWEAMVRAELGNGNRDKALDLLERVKARRFPAAVYHRISGIMLDDSVSPWQQSNDLNA
ncbi:hypothetical protein BC629DRAFT_1596686 [Irpex lacteus]|nr:hypothetical protein BC629DRAFT_1596686 [Irpex lacteus]